MEQLFNHSGHPQPSGSGSGSGSPSLQPNRSGNNSGSGIPFLQPSGDSGSGGGGSPSSPASVITVNDESAIIEITPLHADHYRMLMSNDFESLKGSTHNSDLSELVWEVDNSRVLHLAGNANLTEVIDSLIHHNSSLLLCKNSRGDLPIHAAVGAGHLDAVKMLVEYANDDERQRMLVEINDDENTALHVALENQQLEMAKYLFDECKQTFYLLNNQQISPLYLAIKAGFWKLVGEMLGQLDHIQGAETQLCEAKLSVVRAAIKAKNMQTLEFMVRNCANLIDYTVDEEGRGNPLSYAAYTGFLDGVRLLNEKRPNLAFKFNKKDGSFPIHDACRGGNLQIVKELLGKNPTTKWVVNMKGQNILHVAAGSGKTKIVKYLLREGDIVKQINRKDEDGNTPLHLASINKHPGVVYALTWNDKVKLNLQNKIGFTALDLPELFGEVSSFRERLTWMALRYGGAPRSPIHMHTTEVYPDMDDSSNPLDESNTQTTSQKYPPHYKKRKNKYKDRLNTLLVVSTLVATVTFASGYTVPGGYIQDGEDMGMAALAHKTAFKVFVICTSIAMYSSILAEVTLIWAHLDDPSLVMVSLNFALPFLAAALAMMAVAFMAALFVVLPAHSWLGVAVLVMGGVFFWALMVFFIPLFSPTSCKYKILRYAIDVPFRLMLLACEMGTNETIIDFNYHSKHKNKVIM